MDVATISIHRPKVTVYRDWLLPRKNKCTKIHKQPDVTPVKKSISLPLESSQRFEFVHANKPGRHKDAEVRNLIRKHVRQDHAVKTVQSKLKAIGTTAPILSLRNRTRTPTPETRPKDHTSHHIFRNLGSPTSLTMITYPIKMHPQTYTILDHYLRHTTMSTLHSIPANLQLRPHAWLEFAITDAALLHGVLYAGALYQSLQHGERESKDTVYHQSQVVLLVNKRLSEATPIADSTIGAITCLALGAAVSGDQALWKVHMKGIREMIRTRGDISSLDTLLQSKIRRSDISGAIDYASAPHLPFKRSGKPTTWNILPRQQRQKIRQSISQILSNCSTNPKIIHLLIELANFFQVIQYNRQAAFVLLEQDFYWIQHEFLAFPDVLEEQEEEMIDRALRMGALLYMKCILQEFPYSVVGDSILLRCLKESLEGLSLGEGIWEIQIWLLVIGGVLSKGGMRDWFLRRLRILGEASGVRDLDDEHLGLGRYLGLREVFGGKVEEVWGEAMVMGVNML